MNQTLAPDPDTLAALRQVALLARSGRHKEARAFANNALESVGDRAPLHAIVGRLACEAGDFLDGIGHLREALQSWPNDVAVRCDLTAALLEIGKAEEALAIADGLPENLEPGPALAQLRGYAAQQLGRHAEAVEAYSSVVAKLPGDAAAWNNLGNALAGLGDHKRSVSALERAVALDPGSAPARLNLASALVAAERSDEALAVLGQAAVAFPGDPRPCMEKALLADWVGRPDLALQAQEEAARRAPRDPEILVELGNHRGAAWDLAGAESAYRQALAVEPSHAAAYVALAVLYEHDNRSGQLEELAAQARSAGLPSDAVAMVEAFAFRRARKWEQALAAAEAASPELDPARRAQLIGECRDRLGDHAGAFDAFAGMNSEVASDPREPELHAQSYRDMVDRNRQLLTRAWFDSWTTAVPISSEERSSPVFLVGFPRSGTTLLDTMLMGHPRVQVFEEQPALVRVEHRLGGMEALPALDAETIRGARDDYWQLLSESQELRDNALVIDKMPLYLNKAATIHRLFPDARIILALRHPLDVVLSCFTTNFRPNPAMANFLNLKRTAELYDASMASFAAAREVFGIDVFEIVYERMVANPQDELRPLFDWLGLEWQAEALDHQATAARRGLISTASYAQVHEPIYTRSSGRWVNYRTQLEPVRGTLAPWVERFGYSVEDGGQFPSAKAR